MKTTLYLFSACLLAATPAFAQAPAGGLPPVVVATPDTAAPASPVPVAPSGRRLERSMVRQQLSIAPKALPVSPAGPAAPLPPGQTVVTKKTVTTAAPGAVISDRVYNPERNVVVVQTQTETRELPFVAIPVLFVKDTDELLDQESRAALEETAAAIKEVQLTDPNAVYDIEGHTSTEGTDEHNMQLSAARAQRIYDELTQRYGVPAQLFTAHGYGENYARHPDAPEEQLQLDRRVLVVRTQ